MSEITGVRQVTDILQGAQASGAVLEMQGSGAVHRPGPVREAAVSGAVHRPGRVREAPEIGAVRQTGPLQEAEASTAAQPGRAAPPAGPQQQILQGRLPPERPPGIPGRPLRTEHHHSITRKRDAVIPVRILPGTDIVPLPGTAPPAEGSLAEIYPAEPRTLYI